MAKRRKPDSLKAEIVYTGLEKRRFTVVLTEKDTVINQ